LKNGRDCERKATSAPGVFLLKLPQFKGRAPSPATEVDEVNLERKPAVNEGEDVFEGSVNLG
jgi:hypothetical protein